MTQEEKELLLKDLSARLSYGVKMRCGGVLIGKIHQRYMKEICDTTLYGITEVYDNCYAINAGYDLIETKPYLRSMGSMTEEERKEYNEYLFHGASIGLMSNTETACELIDWLNKKMFDYRGLIPMRLALEAPEGMYNIIKGE